MYALCIHPLFKIARVYTYNSTSVTATSGVNLGPVDVEDEYTDVDCWFVPKSWY